MILHLLECLSSRDTWVLQSGHMDGQRRKDARIFTHDVASATDLYDDDDDDDDEDEDDDSVKTL